MAIPLPDTLSLQRAAIGNDAASLAPRPRAVGKQYSAAQVSGVAPARFCKMCGCTEAEWAKWLATWRRTPEGRLRGVKPGSGSSGGERRRNAPRRAKSANQAAVASAGAAAAAGEWICMWHQRCRRKTCCPSRQPASSVLHQVPVSLSIPPQLFAGTPAEGVTTFAGRPPDDCCSVSRTGLGIYLTAQRTCGGCSVRKCRRPVRPVHASSLE